MKKCVTFSILMLLASPFVLAQNGFYNQLRSNPSESSYYTGFAIVESRYYLELSVFNVSLLHDDPFNDGTSFSLFSGIGGLGALSALVMSFSGVSDSYLPVITLVAVSPVLLSNTSFHYNIIRKETEDQRNKNIFGLKFSNRTDYFMGQSDHFWRYSPAIALEYAFVEATLQEHEYQDIHDDWSFGVNAGIEKPIDLNQGHFYWRNIVPFIGIYYVVGYY